MAYYQDPHYQQEARRAVITLGHYFTSRWKLKQALDLGRSAPGRWFDGALPHPDSLVRIQRFLQLAARVDELSHDQRASGRFFAAELFGGAVLDDRVREEEILEKARAYFLNGVPPLSPRAQWRETLTDKHPDLLELDPSGSPPAGVALSSLLGETLAD